jgi:hypothetical protein
LLDHPRLVAQLCALERRTARGGRDSIDHPPGAHDDVANAAAGALVLSGGDKTATDWAAFGRAFKTGAVGRPAVLGNLPYKHQ